MIAVQASAVPGLMLAEPGLVRELAGRDAEFAAFLEQADRSAGPRVSVAEAQKLLYRVTLPRGTLHYDLRYESRLGNADASPALSELLAPTLATPRESLLHAVWVAQSYTELQGVLSALRAVVRFAPSGPRGEVQGHVMMSGYVNLLLQLLAHGERTMSDGEPLFDAVTRSYGLRDKARRLAESTTPGADREHLTDAGLGRTLVQQRRR